MAIAQKTFTPKQQISSLVIIAAREFKLTKTMKKEYESIMEKKAENFVRLAKSRTNAVIDGLRLIGNLSNTNNYSFTSDQIEKIFAALQSELDDTKRKFIVENKKPFTLE